MTYDVAVVGLGGMGSAILAHCAWRGASVIGLEQFPRGHALGASSGKSRLIRKAYFEDPAYVPLLHRAYELWHELERESGKDILRITGLLTVGPEGSEIIAGTRRAAREHGLPIELLERREINARYPTLRLQPGEVGIFEPEGGVLKPEEAIEAHLKTAAAAGGEMRFAVGVEKWEASSGGFEVKLEEGSHVSARALVLSLGPWLQQELSGLGIPLRIQRNVQAWFTPAVNAYAGDRFPPFLLNRTGLPAPLYGFPDLGDGVKAAFHGFGETTEAQHLNREVDMARDVAPLVRAMDGWMPGAAAAFREAKPCMYALTPDQHFIIDRHPQHPKLVLCGGFSGHGFKFAPVIGEIVADLALEGGSQHEIGFLSLRRFGRKEPDASTI